MRLSELAKIDLSEMNWEEGFILVHGKGNIERWASILVSAIGAVWTSLDEVGYSQKRWIKKLDPRGSRRPSGRR
jgi:site-specific recombinase XerD